MKIHTEVPFSLNDITAEWLTNSLRESGVIGEESVSAFEMKPVGEAAGFNGEVVILSLSYSEPLSEAPKTMVMKIPTALKNRILGQTLGLYEKEIRFYRDLNPEMNIRTPGHYYSALDAADDPDMVLERLKGINKLPMWLISMVIAFGQWVVQRTPRRYVLLIEDLSRFRLGDQVRGCSEEDVRRVLRTLAALHAQFWDSDKLQQMSWISPVESTSRIIHLMYLQSGEKFRKAELANLTDRQHSLIDWLRKNGAALTEMLGKEPRTLLHGDVRLDNVCFDDDHDDVILYDWQTMLTGPAGMDLAYFLSATLPLDVSDEETAELISFYHDQLAHHGIEISLDQLQWQYEACMLAILHRNLPTVHQHRIDLGSDRGPQMIRDWVYKTYARLEGVDFESVFDRARS
ncbi:MAG: phosphotransferase [Gammaproteobacteria bacterium]|jgi:hypothetical protein|nr:phosphotransferase [Gammaproteobacteria bacterium]MBT4494980.1 phosphotransferase [Gammaproteobacteria bacterium]MBT7371495.1 phosphotransferase [Gammaproteobacteria bacterium]